MAQMLRGTCAGSVMPQSDGGDHVAVLERGDEAVALVGIVPQPVQQLRESPLGGVDAAAPLDGFEARRACAVSVIWAASSPGAVVAPEVVIVERLELLADRE